MAISFGLKNDCLKIHALMFAYNVSLSWYISRFYELAFGAYITLFQALYVSDCLWIIIWGISMYVCNAVLYIRCLGLVDDKKACKSQVNIFSLLLIVLDVVGFGLMHGKRISL